MARARGSYPRCPRFKSRCRYHAADVLQHGPLVKWLRHRPFTAVTRVRVSYGSPTPYGERHQGQTWRHSSAGRALASHARGHRFEFCCLHQNPEALRLQDFFIATRNGKRNEYGIEKGKRKTLEPKFEGFKKWRRRRDSNPRDPFGAYTISNRARSTKLRDFSVFALRFVVLFCFAWLVRDKQQWEL